MSKRDEEVVVRATPTHRLVREGERWEDLLPLTPGAPSYRIRTPWRVERKDVCQECDEFVCRCSCECGVEYEQQQCPECLATNGDEAWEVKARITVFEAHAPEHPLRVEMEFGDMKLSSTNDPQVMVWLAELLQEVAAESSGAFDIPVERAGAGELA